MLELPTVNPSTLRHGHLMKRIALCGGLRTSGGRTVEVVNVHNEPFARRHQRRISNSRPCSTTSDQKSPDVTILCGDFNPSP